MNTANISSKRVSCVLAAALCLVTNVATASAPQSTLSSVTITGRVTAADTGAPLSNVTVRVMEVQVAGYGSTEITTANTDPAGYYTATLDNATYSHFQVQFDAPLSAPQYAGEWYPDRRQNTSAAVLALAPQSTIANIDAALDPTGVLTGTVNSQLTGQALPNARVTAFNEHYDLLDSVQADFTGQYAFTKLPEGRYKLRVDSPSINSFYVPAIGLLNGITPYVGKWYPDAADFVAAALLTVTQSATATAAPVQLAWGGMITGELRDESDQPIFAPSGFGSVIVQNLCDGFGTGIYGAGMKYLVAGLPTTRVNLLFNRTGYLPEFYDNKPYNPIHTDISEYVKDPANYTVVSITQGLTTTIIPQLARGATVGGRVTDSGGAPLQATNLHLISVDVPGEPTGFGASASQDGTYQFAGVPAGQYILMHSFLPGYAATYFPGVTQRSAATVLTIAAGETRLLADFPLVSEGALTNAFDVTGTVVVSGTGTPLANLSVQLTTVDQQLIQFATSSASGQFTFTNVPSDTYLLAAFGTSEGRTYSPGGVASWIRLSPSTANPVTIPLVALGVITGSVTASDTGKALPGVEVGLINEQGKRVYARGNFVSGAYGEFSFLGVAPGRYTMRFFERTLYGAGCEAIRTYRSVYLGGELTSGSATYITLAPGGTQSVSQKLQLTTDPIPGANRKTYLPLVRR